MNQKILFLIAKKSGNTEFIKFVKSLELIEADDLEKVNQLIEEGADPQFKNIDGKTALNYATNPEVIFALIKALPKRERNSYINKKDKNGDTVLHYLAHRIPAEKEDEKYTKIVEI